MEEQVRFPKIVVLKIVMDVRDDHVCSFTSTVCFVNEVIDFFAWTFICHPKQVYFRSFKIDGAWLLRVVHLLCKVKGCGVSSLEWVVWIISGPLTGQLLFDVLTITFVIGPLLPYYGEMVLSVKKDCSFLFLSVCSRVYFISAILSHCRRNLFPCNLTILMSLACAEASYAWYTPVFVQSDGISCTSITQCLGGQPGNWVA